ncbi:hypothetical protein [Candidatus Pelagisphaera phototrophica]|uniref:hypothetical protein n=1 Tax=Candidatus Pelagisphaera phototrophica TaxID=2684113 RepID=UPI0019FDC6BE|nr:hypothetical protein [Candidatus Pelagisphaera phototrophica]QXD32188.1 hypothetical protein GA004_00215 [Candidatus Pelagisphaera phototrophica]
MAKIALKPNLQIGIVPTHIKFVGGLVPDENGKMPRGQDGKMLISTELEHINQTSRIAPNCAQTSVFPGTDEGDMNELIEDIKSLGLKPHMIMMVAGGNPMDPADEDKISPSLLAGLEVAKKHGVEHVASTSFEEWMKPGAETLTGNAFDDAVAQLVKLHTRVCQEADILNSSVKAWHMEFLRGTEFQTFTDISKAWTFVKAANEAIGKPFFKVLVDAAHCGDSILSMEENVAVIQEMGKADGFSMFHASAKTTRGCLSTDDGWIGNLLTACAATGKLEIVLVELFHHEDAALAGLREADPRHGIDTTDGRTYSETVCDGLEEVAHRLNNLVNRSILPR